MNLNLNNQDTTQFTDSAFLVHFNRTMAIDVNAQGNANVHENKNANSSGNESAANAVYYC